MRRLIDRITPTAKTNAGKPTRNRLRQLKFISLSLVALTLASSAVIVMADREKFTGELIRMTAGAGLRLEQIQVRGRAHTPKDRLLTAINLRIGQPILGIDLRATHQKIREIGWVEDATVERRLPGTIHITLRERVPIALLQTRDAHRLIDRSGTIIDGADPSQFTHLTVVAGEDAGPQAHKILAILKTEPELFAEVWAISYRAKRRWDVHLKSGMEIRLPELDPVSAWSRLAIIDRNKQIINRDLAVIDLRVPQQLVVEPNIPVRGKGSRT